MTTINFVRDNGVSLNYQDLLKIQANRKPFLFMDSAFNVIEEKQAGSSFYFEKNWDIFDVHFNNNPLVPASIMIEMMMQTTALAPLLKYANNYSFSEDNIPIVYLTSVKNANFKSKILPDSHLEVLSVINWRKGNFGLADSVIYNSKKLAATASFQFFCDFRGDKY